MNSWEVRIYIALKTYKPYKKCVYTSDHQKVSQNGWFTPSSDTIYIDNSYFATRLLNVPTKIPSS